MTDISSWLGSGDPPTLDSLLDLSDAFGHTENHAAQNMDVSWLDNETFVDGYSLFDGYISSNPIGPDEYASQTQEQTFPGLENLPEIFVGESHDSILPGAGPQVTPNSGLDQTTTNEQRKKRPRSPTSHSPQPRKKSGVASSRPSKHRAKLSPSSKKVLEDFFEHNIYPEPNDVTRLAEQMGVEKQQIKTWFRNQRARKLNVNMSAGSKDIPESPCGPSGQTFATVLADVPSIDPKTLMERYLGVPLDEDNRMPTRAAPVARRRKSQKATRSNGSRSSCGSKNSWSSRRGRRKVVEHGNTGQYDPISDPSKFRCTFCGEGLKDRYQWKRHEETKHAPRTGWICKDTACANKPTQDSIFFREDLFTQHRIKHAAHGSSVSHNHSQQSLTNFEIVLANPIPQAHPALQCGFCGERLPDWVKRVAHIAAHFEKGANLSSWWLKRAEFITEKKDPQRRWLQDDFKAILPHSAFCIYCQRLYLSLENAEARHHQCTVWCCGQFEGILAAYEKSTTSEYSLWSCIYCDKTIFEVAPDHSKRLSHLVMEHAYRSCTPQIFQELSDFRDHLMSYHNTLPSRAAGLESACRLTRKSHFKSAADISSTVTVAYCSPVIYDRHRFAKVDIIGRSFHAGLCFASMTACFDLRAPHNILSRETLQTLRLRIDLQMEESESAAVDTPVGHIGYVIIQWAGDSPRRDFPLPTSGVHTTKCFVVDCGCDTTLTFGGAVIEELNMVQQYLPPV